jgi:site-specific recombinase XerD
MSEQAVKVLLEQPSPLTKKGLRDRFIILLMDDTAARLQELIDIRLCDIKLGKTPVIILNGKGSKTRSVPLMKKTVEQYKNYIRAFHPDEGLYSDQPLFYTMRYQMKTPLGSSTVRKLIISYGAAARQCSAEVPAHVHPHMLRHSRAMHLYQHGMDLTLVSQWLGHVRLETTLIYAHADTEHKRKAIAAATPANSPLRGRLNAKRFTVSDENTLKQLYGLK